MFSLIIALRWPVLFTAVRSILSCLALLPGCIRKVRPRWVKSVLARGELSVVLAARRRMTKKMIFIPPKQEKQQRKNCVQTVGDSRIVF